MAVLSGWTETILLSLAFVIVITVGVAGMNGMYHKSNVIPLVDNHTMSSFVSFANSSQKDIHGGTVLTGSVFGVNIAQSYKILLGVLDLVWNFISGGWINSLAGMMMLGASGMWLATVFQIIWFLSILFGLLYIFFKVVV